MGWNSDEMASAQELLERAEARIRMQEATIRSLNRECIKARESSREVMREMRDLIQDQRAEIDELRCRLRGLAEVS